MSEKNIIMHQHNGTSFDTLYPKTTADQVDGLQDELDEKQNVLDTQTAYTSKGSGTKVPQITTNNLGQVTNITEVDITKTTLSDLGITATSSELNVLDGITASTTELNYIDGVTSSIQTQLNNKEAADATILKKAQVIDNVTSTTTDQPLSANQGKALNDRINNLETIGRYLALWDCTTGLPTTDPTTMPYTYKAGDYYRVSAVGNSNYKPTGSTYNHVASTTVETESVQPGDVYFYDGTNWTLQYNHISGLVTDVQVDSTSVVSGSTANITLSSFGVNATSTELNYTDGVTSNIQTQLNAKPDSLSDLGVTSTAAELNILDGATLTTSELNVLDGITATTAELNYTDGVTSNIQTQFNAIPTTIDTKINNILNVYYNAGTDRTVVDNRSTAILYVINNLITSGYGYCTIRYDGGYYYKYFIMNGAISAAEPSILEINTYGGEMNLWGGNSAKTTMYISKTLATTAYVTSAISGKENTSNKTITISSSSTDTQYPTAKAVYTAINNSIVSAIEGSY